MDPVIALRALGGSARWSQLCGRVPRRRLAAAERRGEIRRTGKVYTLAPDDQDLISARQLHGVRSHRSAAKHHGFALPPSDDGPDVMIPAHAARRSVPRGVRLRRGELSPAERTAAVTSPLLTVVHCLRDLTLREALSVGDSALRSGRVEYQELAEALWALRGPGSKRARQRFEWLDARAANAFESCARAMLLEAGVAGFEPQLSITHRDVFIGRVDLAHRVLKIVIECDGFETHGTLEAMTRDLTRHTWLVSAGWRPLRLTWYQVMFQPEWVLGRVIDTIEQARRSQIATQRRTRTHKVAA